MIYKNDDKSKKNNKTKFGAEVAYFLLLITIFIFLLKIATCFIIQLVFISICFISFLNLFTSHLFTFIVVKSDLSLSLS